MKAKGNMVIAQSGGPSMVINQSLVGAILAARSHRSIGKIYGALHGISGILKEDFVDLRKVSLSTLECVAKTPSSALGSIRKKPTLEECKAIFAILKKRGIRYFFYIGGNDSAETVNIVNEEAKREGADVRCFHIPKTIDNDLRGNDHTPGFGSAARFVAMAFMGDNLDNRALGGVKINVVMGRNAGFLTASSALARVFPKDGPHLIYLPECPFSIDGFCADVQKVMKDVGRCVVAVSEGVSDKDGTPIVVKLAGSAETDSHGNVQLSGTGALGDVLAQELKKRTDIKRVRADTFGYLQRSFPGVASKSDSVEARAVGKMAVKFATSGKWSSGSVAMVRKSGKAYGVRYERIELNIVAKETKHMPDSFIKPAGNDVTAKFIAYAKPLVGELPKVGRIV